MADGVYMYSHDSINAMVLDQMLFCCNKSLFIKSIKSLAFFKKVIYYLIVSIVLLNPFDKIFR